MIPLLPNNAVGGKIQLALGTLLYNQHNKNLTQNTQPHTTTNHNKMARHQGTSAKASTDTHSPPVSATAQFASSPHHGRCWALSVLYFLCAVGVAWGAKKATHHEMERGAGPRP